MTTERRIGGHCEDPRTAHHLWAVDEDDKGVRVRRNRQEPEMFSSDEKRVASNLSQQIAAEKCAAILGVFGADLVDNPILGTDLPAGVVRSFNTASRVDETPKVYTWDELRNAFSDDAVSHVRRSIGQGMKTRMASKALGVPFIVAADILDKLPNVSADVVKRAVDFVKAGKADGRRLASMDFVTRRVAAVLAEYHEPSTHRLAVDEKAAAYWEAYYGPFGKELVREVQKRVRADLAGEWLRKNGVDEVAAEYWRNYFGEYGDKWVSVVPKKLSPSNARQ
jgi:hypothetical protein